MFTILANSWLKTWPDHDFQSRPSNHSRASHDFNPGQVKFKTWPSHLGWSRFQSWLYIVGHAIITNNQVRVDNVTSDLDLDIDYFFWGYYFTCRWWRRADYLFVNIQRWFNINTNKIKTDTCKWKQIMGGLLNWILYTRSFKKAFQYHDIYVTVHLY